MFDLSVFFQCYGHHGVCSQCRENEKKKLVSIYLARGRVRENSARINNNFNIKIIISEN